MATTYKTLEYDDEVKFLALRVPLDNGLTGPVVTKIGLKYQCNVCSVAISSPFNLKEHMLGKNHTKSMARDPHPAAKFPEIPIEERKMTTVGSVELAPGEPVPPGFEDEVRRIPEIMETLKAMVSPLLGLEFLAEVVGASKETEVRYLCMLCDKKGTSSTVMQHLVCFNHRIRYLAKFFPKTYSALQAVPKITRYRRGTGEILSRIARAIEAKFGRFEPVVFDEEDFEEKKPNLFHMMMEGPHATETPTCQYHTMVDLDEISKIAAKSKEILDIDKESEEAKRMSATAKTAFKYGLNKDDAFAKKSPPRDFTRNRKRVSGSPISTLSSLSSSSEGSRNRSRGRRVSRSPKRTRFYNRKPAIPSTSRFYTRGRSRSRSRSYSRSRSRSRSPTRNYRRHSPYRRKFQKRSPPRYTRRDSPVSRSRPTVSSFSIKQTPTLSQMDLEEEKARKLKIRQYEDYAASVKDEMAQKLKVYEKTPEKHPMYSEEWKKFWNKRYKELVAEGKDALKYDYKPEWVKCWTAKIKEIHEEELSKRLNAFRNDLGLPVLTKDVESDDDVVIIPQPLKHDPEPEILEEDNSLIHVLRLLAALENQLGSFRVRVNALFTKALSLEKVEKCSADTLLDMPEIIVLLEGVKEKLKGQLFTDVIDRHLIKGTKKVIQGLASVLANHEKMKQEKLKPPEPAEPLVVPGIGVIDKAAISYQIAAILVAQGRGDLSEEELEQIVNAAIGLANPPVPKPVAVAPQPEIQDTTALQTLLSTVTASQMESNHDKTESPLLKNREERSQNSKSRMVNEEDENKLQRSLSPFSLRQGGTNPVNKDKDGDDDDDDDDDDYSYEDIFRAAKKNVKKEQAKKKLDKQLAQKMINDQQKTTNIIDPDDLLNGIKSSMAQNTVSVAPVEQQQPNQQWDGYQFTAQPQQFDFSADGGYNFTNDQNYPPQGNYQQPWAGNPPYQSDNYNTNNGYDYSQQMYNAPPPDVYANPPPGNYAQPPYQNYY